MAESLAGPPWTDHLAAVLPHRPLKGVKVVSLALNLPGPAALARLRSMGADCVQVLPPTGDPMAVYSAAAYGDLGRGLRRRTLDLKSPSGQRRLHALLTSAQVVLTSFRPAALQRLGLDAAQLTARFPALSGVAIVGALGSRADAPGHDLTYQADVGLVPGHDLPPSLLADMAGALAVSEAVLQVVLLQRQTGRGAHLTVGLAESAQWLSWPLHWQLTNPGGLLGGRHAGYRVYACKGGRVALAALEPHFVSALGRVLGVPDLTPDACLTPAVHQSVADFMARRTRRQLQQIAARHDLPLHTLPPMPS